MLGPTSSTSRKEENKQTKTRPEEKTENIVLPKDWWEATNSFNNPDEENTPEVKVYKLKKLNSKKTKISEDEIKANVPKFDASKGDYLVEDDDYFQRDYSYYSNQRKNLSKYLFYLYIFVGLLVVYTILHFIAS